MDFVIEKIMKADYEEKLMDTSEENKNIESRLVNLFETEFRKPLSVLDIQTVTKWLNDDNYSYEEIKNALYEASKVRKLTIRYVDGILLNKDEVDDSQRYNQTTLIKDIKKIWQE